MIAHKFTDDGYYERDVEAGAPWEPGECWFLPGNCTLEIPSVIENQDTDQPTVLDKPWQVKFDRETSHWVKNTGTPEEYFDWRKSYIKSYLAEKNKEETTEVLTAYEDLHIRASNEEIAKLLLLDAGMEISNDEKVWYQADEGWLEFNRNQIRGLIAVLYENMRNKSEANHATVLRVEQAQDNDSLLELDYELGLRERPQPPQEEEDEEA